MGSFFKGRCFKALKFDFIKGGVGIFDGIDGLLVSVGVDRKFCYPYPKGRKIFERLMKVVGFR